MSGSAWRRGDPSGYWSGGQPRRRSGGEVLAVLRAFLAEGDSPAQRLRDQARQDQGEFVWHTHDDTDELLLVVDGTLTIQLRDGDVTVTPGQLYVVPRGVEHCPIADGEVQAMLIEPTRVTNTGDAGGSLTGEYDDSLL